MSVEVVPLDARHLTAAGALLALRSRADRRRTPSLPARYESVTAATALVRDLTRPPRSTAVVALRRGEVTGFLAGELLLGAHGSRDGLIPAAGHAVAPEADPCETFAALYGALASVWLRAGCRHHYVVAPAHDRAALGAWWSLGFGDSFVRAVRPCAPAVAATPAALGSVRQAGPPDLADVMRLGEALRRHEAAAPVFRPALADPAALAGDLGSTLANPRHAVFLSEQDGRVVGMVTMHPATMLGPYAVPARAAFLGRALVDPTARGDGVGAALLARALRWATDQGCTSCVLNYRSENLSGARFWHGHGFEPLTRELCRVLDDRLFWA